MSQPQAEDIEFSRELMSEIAAAAQRKAQRDADSTRLYMEECNEIADRHGMPGAFDGLQVIGIGQVGSVAPTSEL